MGYESDSPIHDLRYRVRNFKHNEDFKDIKKVLLSTKRVYSDPYFSTSLDSGKEWRRPRNISRRPKFVDGKPNRFDSLQGKLGDCWLIAAMEVMTLNEDLVKFVIPRDQEFDRNYVGAFHFRIWQLGVWYDVVVDDQLPVFTKNGKLCYAHSGNGDVFWAALLEKAFAKFTAVTGQKALYENLVGGQPLTGLQDLSGAIVERILLRKPPPGITMNWLFRQVYSRNLFMTCTVRQQNEPPLGIIPFHTYAVTKLFKFEDNHSEYPGLFLVQILNPWGHGEWQGWWSDDDSYLWRKIDRRVRQKLGVWSVPLDDGEFWMEERDFVRRFQSLFICHLEPGNYLEKHKIKPKFNTWNTTTVYGEWVKNFSAMGRIPALRHKNPQYMFQLQKPKKDSDNSQSYNTVIDLVVRSKGGRNDRHNVAFYVYLSAHFPLTYEDFFNPQCMPLDNNPDFISSCGRAFVTSFSLKPGNYIVIPCTQSPNIALNFMLRVFSECQVLSAARYDGRVSKSLPIEERNIIECYASRMFIDSAWSMDGIDCTDLKKILEVAMNPNCSVLRKSMSFFKNIGELFRINIISELFKKYESGHVVFTKDECRSMISMLDADKSGKLSISELCNLWNKICFWTKVYDQHKDDEKGYIKLNQLRDALSSIGYDVTKRTVHSLSYIYTNEEGLVCLTDFILCGVTLETVLSLVDKSDVKNKSEIVFTLDEWVTNTLML